MHADAVVKDVLERIFDDPQPGGRELAFRQWLYRGRRENDDL